MPTELDPIADNWYLHLDKGQPFQVVAVDEQAKLVEIQHFDGDLEEISINEWRLMDIAPGEEPASWSGPLDLGEVDDYGTEITDTQPADWSESFTEIRLKDEDNRNSSIDEAEDALGEGETQASDEGP